MYSPNKSVIKERFASTYRLHSGPIYIQDMREHMTHVNPVSEWGALAIIERRMYMPKPLLNFS